MNDGVDGDENEDEARDGDGEEDCDSGDSLLYNLIFLQ
jgi:hypothetical protein